MFEHSSVRQRLSSLAPGILLLLGACAAPKPDIAPQPGPVRGVTPAEADARAEQVRRDPVAFIHQVAGNCDRLDQYTLTFIRSERRGLFHQLCGPERIACRFRRVPFSIYMKWLDEDVKYGESTYVAGQKDNQVRFIPRHGFLGLPPTVTAVDLQTPVTWGESRYPLTDFGLQRMMERTLKSMKDAGNAVVIQYEGLRQLPDDGPTVHAIRLEYPQTQHPVPVQELYIDINTNLPAGTAIKHTSGEIDAVYYYRDLNPNVKLTDADFLLAAEREAPGTSN